MSESYKSQSPELQRSNPEVTHSNEINTDNNESLNNKIEQEAQDHKESVDHLRAKVETQSISRESFKIAENSRTGGAKNHPILVNKQLKDMAYSRALTRARKHLSMPSRALSKIVHSKIIDKPSEVIGKTAARPSAMMGGALFALIGTSALLWTTKHYGYEYNYLAVGILFIGGMAIGLLAESLLKLLRRK